MSKMRELTLSNCEKKFLIKCLSEHRRLDGRAFDEFREFTIAFGKDWGCCHVSLGQTKVIAQVSCEIQVPKSSRPSEGILNINIELSSLAAVHFEAGRQTELSVRLNRILEKCLKDSKAIDLESLCIKMNEKVWAFRVDVNVLNHEGNILDCASVAALAALMHFRRPDVTFEGEEFIIHSHKQKDPLPTVIHHYPISTTYSIFNGGEYIIADPSLLEEGVSDAYLTLGINSYKELCGLHLGGNTELTPAVILKTSSNAAHRVCTIIERIKEAIEKDEVIRKQKTNFNFHTYIDTNKKNNTNDLEECFDQWKSRKEKRKQTNLMRTDDKITQIKILDKGTATLINNEDNQQHWISNSEDEEEEEEEADDNDVMIIDTVDEKTKVETYEILDTDSEEENVIVLNADKQTKKKK